jgi:hypothetical protein
LRLDNLKTQGLQELNSQIVYGYFSQKEVLPRSIEELEASMLGSKLPRDPESNELYEYKKVTDVSFTLCANFNLSSNSNSTTAGKPEPLGARDIAWKHGAGNQCFDRTIDPKMVIPAPKR